MNIETESKKWTGPKSWLLIKNPQCLPYHHEMTISCVSNDARHSKLKPIYPKTKMPKNCSRLDIKTGASLRCEKVRKNQKRVCSPKEWGFIGPKPPRSILAKYDLKRGCFLLLKTGPKGSISPKNCLKGLWLTIKLI